jgi:hypothetical protein
MKNSKEEEEEGGREKADERRLGKIWGVEGAPRLAEATQGLKGGRNGENSANNKGLTFSLSCYIRSGPLSRLRRQNTTHFFSSDEQQASRRGEE